MKSEQVITEFAKVISISLNLNAKSMKQIDITIE